VPTAMRSYNSAFPRPRARNSATSLFSAHRTLSTSQCQTRFPIHKDISDDLDVMRPVLDLGSHALLELQDTFGNLPLHAAPSSRTPLEKVQILVEPSPGSLRVRNAGGLMPLQVALSITITRFDVVQFLLERLPGSVTSRDARGRTLLHLALAFMDPSMHRSYAGFIHEPVELWPDAVQVRDSSGLWPCHVAATAVATSKKGRPGGPGGPPRPAPAGAGARRAAPVARTAGIERRSPYKHEASWKRAG
jgi:hypothetical protein